MPNREISTTEIVLDALSKDKKVFIPYIYTDKTDPKSKVMDMLRLKDEDDLWALKPDAWGIPSLSADNVDHRENLVGGFGPSDSIPDPSTQPAVDLVFMPGMAFDQHNHRLGHGKGFYDKYISRLQQGGPTETSSRSRPALSNHLFSNIAFCIFLTTAVGLALREQLLTEGGNVPVDERDWQIDQLVTAD